MIRTITPTVYEHKTNDFNYYECIADNQNMHDCSLVDTFGAALKSRFKFKTTLMLSVTLCDDCINYSMGVQSTH